MAPGLDNHRARRGDIQAEHLEKHRVGALFAQAGHDHLDPPDVKQGRGAQTDAASGPDAAPPDAGACRELFDGGRRGEAPGEFGLAGAVEHRLEGCSFTVGVCGSGHRRIDKIAQEHARGAGLVKGRQQPGGVAAPTAAGIVGHVAKNHRRAGFVLAVGHGNRHGLVDGRQCAREAMAHVPGLGRDVCRQPARRLQIRAGGDDHRQSILRRIAEHEPADHRDVHDVRGLGPLAIGDQVGIRPVGGQQGHGRRGQGQAKERGFRPETAEHLDHQVGRLGGPLLLVHVGIGAVRDQHVHARHHQLGDVGV